MRRGIAPLLATALLLAGCSGDTGDTGDAEVPSVTIPAAGVETTPEPVATEPASAEPETTPARDDPGEPVTSDRGNLVKAPGQLSGIIGADGELIISLWVEEIVRDIECNRSYVESPQNGQFVGVRFRVETDPSLANEPDGEFWLSAHDMDAWTGDGMRVNDVVGSSHSCLSNADTLPVQIGPGEIVEGWVVLDLPTDAATVGVTMYTASGPAGWEWSID